MASLCNHPHSAFSGSNEVAREAEHIGPEDEHRPDKSGLFQIFARSGTWSTGPVLGSFITWEI